MKSKNLRTYSVHATRAHFKVSVTWPPEIWRSNTRIRQFTIVVFRKIFGGLEPNSIWHKDGFMAEARDARGNHVTVEQENWWHQHRPGSTQMRRPICPMVISNQQKSTEETKV